MKLRSGHAVVTGAASGLGLAIARRLRDAGWTLALVDLPAADWSAHRHDEATVVVPFDVRDAAAWRDLHARLRREWPRLDLVVNAAGVGASGEVGTLPEEQWRRVIDTNLVGTALGCETFLPWLREQPAGAHLVNVASISGLVPFPTVAAYAASKAGIVALSESIAAECPRRRPGVTVVCPGFFRSGLLGSWHFESAVESREAERRMAGSWWTAERVAGRVLAAVRWNRRYVVVGVKARWLWRCKRLAPVAVTALVRGLYTRLHRGVGRRR